MNESTSKISRPDRRWVRAGFAAILLLALGLRLIRLGTFPYWHDEVHNLVASEHLYGAVFHGELISNHPPMPYILAAFWRAIGLGGSEWTMRLLPAFAGVAAVAAVFALGRRLFSARAGLYAAFLLAIAPLHVYHSQDLKEYIYLPFVATVMVLWFYRAMESNRLRDWLVYGVLAGTACYTEIFVGPLLVAINGWALFLLRSRKCLWKGWFAGNALGAAMFIPWLGIMLRKAEGTMVKAENWWVPPPSFTGLCYYVKAAAFGYTAPSPWFKIAFALFCALVVFGAVAAFRVNRRGAALVIAWAVVPVAIVYAVSLVTQSIFLIRAMLPYAMALYVLGGVALANLRPRPLRAIAFAAACFLMGTGLLNHYERNYPAMDFPNRPGTHPPRDYSGSAAYILSRWEEGDVVIHCSDATWLPYYWYGFRNMPQYFAGVGGKFIADIKMGNPRNTNEPSLENYWPREPQELVKDARRVWFVFGEWERKYLPGNATDAYRWMDAHFSEVEHHAFMGLDVLLYVRPEVATPLLRDHDDGVTAEVTYGGASVAYWKERLDNGLTPTPVEARRGNLAVAWAEPAAGSAVEPFAQTNARRVIAFSISNRAAHAVEATASFLPSDALVEVPSLYERDPADEAWHWYAQHNPSPPPSNYELTAAVAHFDGAGSGVLDGEVTLGAGAYQLYTYSLGVPGDAGHGRAGLSLRLGGAPVAVAPGAAAEPWGWNWLPGEVFQAAGGKQTLEVQAQGGGEPGGNSVDLLVFAFRRIREVEPARPDRGPDGLGRWPGSLTLGANTAQTFSAEVDGDTGCVDIWVFERGETGAAYRIFWRGTASNAPLSAN